MTVPIDPGLVDVFGSRARVSTLGALANARRPLTAYRIAKLGDAQVIKVSRELRRLERSGVVRSTRIPGGRNGWVLIDGSLRDLFRRRMRVVWWDDWVATVEERALRAQSGSGIRVDLSRFRPTPRLVPNRREFSRPASKDRILSSMGLPTSRKVPQVK